MIRKPEPKEAAKAIVALFKAKGVDIKRSLALEVVAAVEGYNDWNTMAAAMPAANAAKPAKSPKAPKYAKTDDDEGPFTVMLDGAPYDTLERFKRAQDVAEMFAAELDSEYIATIEDAAGNVRAMYVGDHTRHRLYYKDCADTSAALAKQMLQSGIEADPETDVTCFGHPENFYDDIVECAESGINDEGMTFILGYRSFDTDPATGRVAQADLGTPIQLALLVVHGELRYCDTQLPADVRERISSLLSV
jgi:hypothetical protein